MAKRRKIHVISGKFETFYSGSAEHERGVATCIMLDQEMRKTVKGFLATIRSCLNLKDCRKSFAS